MPAQLGGVPLTVTSRKGTALLGSAPAVRAFAAAVAKLGAPAEALEIAYGYDPTGSMTSIILAFRIPGVTAEHLAPVVIQAWLSAGAAGVTTTNATVSGRAARHISYGDKGADEWVVSYGDAVFVVETPDATIAADAIASLRASPAPGSGSPVPPSAGVTSSPGATASP